MAEKIYRIREFAKLLKVCPRTLWRWDEAGTLKAKRTNGGQRFYTHDQYLAYLGINEQKEERKNVIYTRVSTRKQKDDLENQKQYVFDFCAKHGIAITEMLSDFGSGLNYKRKSWNKLLFDVIDKKIDKIIISGKDRFVRFGFDWFEKFCEHFGTKIIVIDNKENTDGYSELVRDIVSILHVFSCRLYGLRKYKEGIKREFNGKHG